MNKMNKALGAKFSFSLANASGATKVICLLAAFFNTLVLAEGAPNTYKHSNGTEITAAGYAIDGVMDDGEFITGVTATPGNAKRTILQFREYVREHGLILREMTVQANNAAAFNQTIEIVKYNPVIGAVPVEFSFAQFKSVHQSSTDTVEMKEIDLELMFDTLMMLTIADGHTLNITMFFDDPREA